ncbi:cell wall metabolism sensor histidine kinase WalK [Leptolyngbya sp. FACHB-261]|uniref:sensor histidine kinase n=1 Tax=Leptolyngbya sp. FACHB-261 TaxID=2692806 RepID=UPI0016844D63|nr:HAMP domain-containing sensor histidine kinase [Leptolyngbya sp. FACHB-261]MBD2099774.1 HAMP domain-containing histidine kinase [Leptolyngbya sp. FACHB-261]
MVGKGWYRAISSVRTRLLVWYFLLTTGTVFISIKTTYSIFCARIGVQAENSALQQANQLNVLVEKYRLKGKQGPDNIDTLFQWLLSSYVPTRGEYIITLVGNRIHETKPELPSDVLEQHPGLVQTWAGLAKEQRQHIETQGQHLYYVAKPVVWNRTQETGSIVVLNDSTTEYQIAESAIGLVMRMTFGLLLIFFLLAWFTAGRVLYPLRLLTKTAHSITESDMTQRIPVQGKDEIAELATTVNEMLDRLQAAFDSQKEFLKDASHELRTPITVIQGHLEMLKYQPQKEETIALVMDELERMSRLVNDLLLLAKAERSDFLRLKPEELDWLTEEIYLKARGLAKRDWRLESKGLSPITVDRQRLTQAVMNLVQNAIRHTKVGDTIALGSAVKGDRAYFWVRDTGEGISPDDQKRIFERFVRATGDLQSEGYGLGLSIVAAIAQSHGGQVELVSQLGHGSTFMIVLPLVQDAVTSTTLNARHPILPSS